MSLSIEYKRRIERWISELEKHFFEPIASIGLTGFESVDFWSYENALIQPRKDFSSGKKWGNPWYYGYFFGELVIPDSLNGRYLVLKPDTGRESLVYINGKAAGSKDRFHFYIPVSKKAITGEKLEIFIESYAGHGNRNGHVGPAPIGTVTVLPLAGKQAVMGDSQIGIWNEEAYLLWIEISTLFDIREKNPQESLRVCEIDKYLKSFTSIVDFECDAEKMNGTIKECRLNIRKAFECKNATTTPTMYMIGHSHLDVAWQWPINETRRKCGRTFSNQLALLEDYEDYKFLSSQPYLYELLKQNYPDIYEITKTEVSKGRIIPEGGMYVESDTNLPNGESLIRQFMYGKRFFKEELGVENRMCWLPDAFGYSASFPQIMAGCGIDYFSTSKILWSYNGGEEFPYISFYWQGVDGTKVLAHNHNGYNSHSRPSFVIDAWNSMQQKEGLRSRIMPFGYGDGGGGALRDHLEFLKLEKDLEGVPKTKICSPIEFFEDLEADIDSGYTKLPVYVGELYLQVHRGVYTSQAKTKKGNRKSEVSLRETEFWTSIALTKGFKHDIKDKLDELWKLLLVNQFHDILPGSSIKRVHDEAERDYKYIIGESENLLKKVIGGFPGQKGYTLFNSLMTERYEIVSVPKAAAIKHNGFLQKMDNHEFSLVRVPACGHVSLENALSETEENIRNGIYKSVCKATTNSIENDLIIAYYSSVGEITGIKDKSTGEIIYEGRLNRLRMYKDVPTMFDAWDIDSMYEETEQNIGSTAEIEILSEGEFFVCILVKRLLNVSLMEQRIILNRGSRRIDFKTRIDWKESHKLLKADFDTNIKSTEALHNIQYGFLARPNHKTRQYDRDRFEVCAQRWTAICDNNRGSAVLNDCKYGVGTNDSTISLSLLRSPLVPDMYADKGTQEFTYSYYHWTGAMKDSGLARESYCLNIPVKLHLGNIMPDISYIESDAQNIVMDTLKPAEDGNGLIMRVYDMLNISGRVKIKINFNIKEVFETDMLENNLNNVDVSNGEILLDINNFQVKTLRLIL